MQVNVGFAASERQVSLTVDLTEEEIGTIVAASPTTVTRLADTQGRTLLIAPGQLAFIDIVPERTQKVGFGVG